MRHGPFTIRVLVALTVTGMVVAPATLLGQEPAAAQTAVSQIDDETMTAYANAYLDIADARDAAHDQLALTGNKTDEAQERIRDELEQQIEEIVEQHGLTVEEYDHITLVVSIDEEQRESFEAIVEELTESGEGDQGAG